MYGSRYAWIMFGEMRPSQIFLEDSKLKEYVECTSSELKAAADRCISTMRSLAIRQDNRKTLSGMVSLVRCFPQKLSYPKKYPWHGNVWDTVKKNLLSS